MKRRCVRNSVIFLSLAFLGCTDADGDPVATVEENAGAVHVEKGSWEYQSSPLTPDLSYDLVIEDADGWLIELNLVEMKESNFYTVRRFQGRVRYEVAGGVFTGPAEAFTWEAMITINVTDSDGYQQIYSFVAGLGTEPPPLLGSVWRTGPSGSGRNIQAAFLGETWWMIEPS